MTSELQPNPASGSAGAIVVAAGSSQRMSGMDKVFAPVLGRPLLAYCIDALEAATVVMRVVIVLGAHNVSLGQNLVRQNGWRKVSAVCLGGVRRQDSVRNGMAALGDVDWVVVHDGARPCLTPDLVARGFEAAQGTGAAIAAVPVTDTVKRVDPQSFIRATPPRSELWAAQTPQVFRRELLERAYALPDSDATDDAALVERLGVAIRVFPGEPSNIKVTTPTDLVIAEALLRRIHAVARPE
jgi:2-C-methyl-D-erythritol 4-phosphate cytidylyltransferase